MRIVLKPLALAVVIALLGIGYFVRARTTAGFVYAGSDSYGYNKLADELLAHHRYALGPAPLPLHWARPPLYPLYVALVKGQHEATMMGGDGWFRIVNSNIALELFGTGLLLCFAVWRMSGKVAAFIALGLLMVAPFNAIATAAALTETLATFFVTATLALLIPPALGAASLGWIIGAAVFFAAGLLTRPETLFIAPAFVIAIRAASTNRSTVRKLAVGAMLGFTLTFAAWPIRNWMAFRDPHFLGGRIDRYSRPVENYEGSWAFLRAIAKDWQPMTIMTTCYYDLACTPTLQDFIAIEPGLDGAERSEIQRLLELRRHEGHTPPVSQGFQKLADARRLAHPIRVEIIQPLSRLLWMWVANHDEFIPPHSPVARWRPVLQPLSIVLLIATCIGGGLLLYERRTRAAALVLLIGTFGRTLAMAYTFYCMPRYILESTPAAYALIAGGLTVAWMWFRKHRSH